MAISISGKEIQIHNIAGQQFKDKYGFPCPVGVRGRNSDNKLYRSQMGWEPTALLVEGMTKTYEWIAEQVEKRGLQS